MQNGSHFTQIEAPRPRRLRRAAGLACGAVSVGAVATLGIIVTGGSSHRPKLLPVAPASQSVQVTTAAAPSSTTTAPAAKTAAPSTTAAAAVLPDGSALPVLVVFDGTTITLAGSVPTQADADMLRALAEANSQSPAGVIDRVVVDPRVPASVGVRVIEMNAVRFSEGSSSVTPGYAPGLNRVINLMRAMPWVTTLVIGHADQTGGSSLNLQLSQARASSVIDYLISQGISADRLSAQGVGASEPLTTQNTTTAWALNRRTEFVFYGIFSRTAR
jgi:outer membrane protein OmpA-like peptidoglycan-associated protein